MKKILIGSLVGAIILFVWSSLAWTILPLHKHTIHYTTAQDTLMKVLSDNNLGSGAYAMPMVDNRDVSGFDSKYHEETEKLMKANEGKPVAIFYYLREGYTMGATIFIRGFLFDFLAVLAACIILVPGFAAMSSFFGRWWLVLMIGLLTSAIGPLLQYNWMGFPWNYTVDMVADSVLNWSITGLWLAWYFRNK